MTTASGEDLYSCSFADPDLFQSSVRGGDNLYTVLGRGAFHADLTTVGIHKITLQNGQETLPRLAATTVPSDKVKFAVWFDKNRLPVIRGVQIRSGELLYGGSGMQSYHRTFGPNQFTALTLDATEFASAAYDFTGRDLGVPVGSIVRPPTHQLERLRSVIRFAIRASKSQPTIISSSQPAKRLEQALLRSMISCLQHEDVHQDTVLPGRQAALARRFSEVVEANLDRPLLSCYLSRMVGVPERTLRKLCREQMGISPSRFLALRRLHLARQALMRAGHHSTTVTEIAMGLGIWELGRFAVAYKGLFGESPSITLRQQW